jgi:hypothetical protein
MASATTGTSGTDPVVVLTAQEDDSDVMERLAPDEARKLAVALMTAAHAIEQPEAGDWP